MFSCVRSVLLPVDLVAAQLVLDRPGDLQKNILMNGTLRKCRERCMTQGIEDRGAGKFMVSSPSSHQAPVLENDIILWSIKGGAWASVGADNS